MSAPSANQLYSSCMEAAGDLIQAIHLGSRSEIDLETRAAANRMNAQAALACIQSAVTIHAAANSTKGGRR